MRRRSPQTRALALAAAGLLVVAAVAVLWQRSVRAPAADPNAPNIVVIMTDDQTVEQVNARAMPETVRLIEDAGAVFEANFATTPQCCPSRATFLTGQYAHNHGVRSNSDGYPALRDHRSVLPVWLQRAGYRTAHVGRWLKNYGETVEDSAQPPPGWDNWTAMTGVRYFNYTLSHDGVRAHYGAQPRDYATTVFTREAVGIIREQVPADRPLFLTVAHVAPHKERKASGTGHCDGVLSPAPRDDGRFAGVNLPQKSSIDEADVSDKPSFIRRKSRLGAPRERKAARAYRCTLAALREVDRSVGRIYNAFRELGEANKTVFIFTSDNGRFHGEHRLPGGKSFPYEESIRVPLLIRLPKQMGGKAGIRIGKVVGNIDLAPTILELARSRPCADGGCRTMDGRSLLPLLRDEGWIWPKGRAVLVELEEQPRGTGRLPCAYAGVRTRKDLYVNYTKLRDPETGQCIEVSEVEQYDLANDPEELDNVAEEAGRPAKRRKMLAERLERLRDCAGLPERDPQQSGRAYCE